MMNATKKKDVIRGTWEEHKGRFYNPRYILTTFEPYDMFIRGFYKGIPNSVDERFLNISTPDMVIINALNDELWLDGFKSGYVGVESYNTKGVLEELNVPQDLIEKVFNFDLYELINRNDSGEYYMGHTNPKSIYRESPYFNLNDIYINIENRRIVHVQPPTLWGQNRHKEMVTYIHHHLRYNPQFLSCIKKVTIFPNQEMAQNKGYYIKNQNHLSHGSSHCFIIESDEQEMWLNPAIKDASNGLFQDEVIELLADLNVPLEKHPEYNHIKEWFRKQSLKIEAQSLVINLK